MRMRKKKNLDSRWEKVADSLATDPAALKGNWKSLLRDAGALRVELGCGKGMFLSACALESPEVLFVGIEKVPEALLMAMEKADANRLPNARFVDGDVAKLGDFFDPCEVDTLYLNFCDPWPPRKQAKRRLTHRSFLELYRRVLKPDGVLLFKTDDAALFLFSQEELAATGARVAFRSTDWHRDPAYPGDDHMTEYETRFAARGLPIYRLEATWGEVF